MIKKNLITIFVIFASILCYGQSEIHPQHFNLSEVELLNGPLKTSQKLNFDVLLSYDQDRLLTPFVRDAGLSNNCSSIYYRWLDIHPSFTSWQQFEGHAGGHYLSALSQAYAACHDPTLEAKFKERLDYCVNVIKDCQDVYNNSTDGMYGFIGGVNINNVWRDVYSGNINSWGGIAYKVPFYCTHKVMAGLRDAWLYAGNAIAKECFRKYSDWHVGIISHLTDDQLQKLLDTEHGGIVETLADAYKLFGDKKYLDAAKRYIHRKMVQGMQTVDTNFLTGYHANTQVPKFTGFERIWQEDPTMAADRKAAENFWTDVYENRTVAIGGNSISEHFIAHDKGEANIFNVDGPETCNSHNMLRLSETLFENSHDSKYADAYEQIMYNHILASQDPTTGGYQYFTSLRPQSYHVYSKVNVHMWCCVGSGMENPNKHGHFIYTHSLANDTLYVNLFTASKLCAANFALTQETTYPYEPKTKITLSKAGHYTLAIRRPSWTTVDYEVLLNGRKANTTLVNGYASLTATFKEGDVIDVNIPMILRYEECPDYGSYIAFKYGPILLAANTTVNSDEEAATTGLVNETLKGEHNPEGNADHCPSAKMSQKSLASDPLLIGNRSEVLDLIQPKDLSKLEFRIKPTQNIFNNSLFTKSDSLTLRPFYAVAHERYQFYWYQPTEEEYDNSDLLKRANEELELQKRTLDFVAPGEQQSETDHHKLNDNTSGTGTYGGELYRDCQPGGFLQYTLFIPEEQQASITKETMLSVMTRFTFVDQDRTAVIYIDGTRIAAPKISDEAYKDINAYGFYNTEFPIPPSLLFDSNGNVKKLLTFRFEASLGTMIPGLYSLRLLRPYM